MDTYDDIFINTFNSYYPFERYILRNPKSITNLFDDAILTELFIPNTEIKPILNPDGSLCTWTKIDEDEIYVKLKTKAGEIRMAYFDFNSHIRENIRDIFYNDFGQYEWECLYVDYGDNESLINLLREQKDMILKYYDFCNIKEDTPNTEFIK